VKPLLISYCDLSGGAGRAAFRLHRGLIDASVECRLRVAVKLSDIWTVEGPSSKVGTGVNLARNYLGSLVIRLQESANPVRHSANVLPSWSVSEINGNLADVVNLHWVGGETLSIEAIGQIHKPVVWTLHDMWAFCGSEHYATEAEEPRWRGGYRRDNRPVGYGRLDIDRWTWNRKRRAWRRPMTIVAPSRWLADSARQSALMRDWPVHVVPNLLDTDCFRPHDKALCREILGLPQGVPLILFGAIGGGKDLRKGFDLLLTALRQLSAEGHCADAHCVIFGQSQPRNKPFVGYPIHWMGHLHDDWSLALLYSATDVVVVPSRQENLPQTGTEAQACGTPVVAFNATGLPDVVEHGVTGYLAQPYIAEDLAHGIRWALEDAGRHAKLSAAARARAVSLWAPEVVVPQYLAVYREAIDGYESERGRHSKSFER